MRIANSQSHCRPGAAPALCLPGFYPVFQAIIGCRDGLLEYHEMLARAEGGDRRRAPTHWIAAGEKNGDVHLLDFAMLEAALARLVRQPALRLGCNVSLYTLEKMGTALIARIARQPCAGPRLVVEITESRPIQCLRTVKRRVAELGALGVAIALDDLGAGHFTVQDIAALCPDYVKLARRLVLADVAARGGHPLVAAVADAARRCGARVIAEGVERASQLAHVRACGIDYAQGYLTGLPAPEPVFLSPLMPA